MADCFSNYLRNAINDHIHGGPDYTRPATTYFFVMTVMPLVDGTGGTVAVGFASATSVTNNSTNWPASASQIKQNATAINFGAASAICTVVGVAEYDAASSGNLLTLNQFSSPLVVPSGTVFSIPVGGAVFGWAV